MANKIEEHEWHDEDISFINAVATRIDLAIGPYQYVAISKEDVMAMAEHFGLLVEGGKNDK